MIRRLLAWPGFLLWYLGELILSNYVVARDIVTPPFYLKPGVVAIPVGDLSPAQLFWFSNLLTMTPGTLSLDLSEEGTCLFVHVMYLDDPEAFRIKVKTQFERRLRKVFP